MKMKVDGYPWKWYTQENRLGEIKQKDKRKIIKRSKN